MIRHQLDHAVGAHGVLNLRAEFDEDGFSGWWSWLGGRTSETRGVPAPLW